MDKEKIKEYLLSKAVNKNEKQQITCATAFEIAEKFNVSNEEIGKMCNELQIKITNCQLGCF